MISIGEKTVVVTPVGVVEEEEGGGGEEEGDIDNVCLDSKECCFILFVLQVVVVFVC